jgi:hypothetical protein
MVRKLKRARELQSFVKSEDPEECQVSGHGGKREGAGRKRIGETQKVSISLPFGYWERFDRLRGNRSRSEFLRDLIMKELDSK